MLVREVEITEERALTAENAERTPRERRENNRRMFFASSAGLSQRTQRFNALTQRRTMWFQALGAAAGSPNEPQRPRIP
jgi:hypothetical protein